MIYILTFVFVLILIWIVEPRLYLWSLHRIVYPIRKGVALGIDKNTYFTNSYFLESHWEVFREEVLESLNKVKELPKLHDVDKKQSKISLENGPAWRTIFLKGYGSWFEDNCKLFPRSMPYFKTCKNVSTVMFSVLEPGVVIPPHTGKLSGILRYQLALEVPKSGNCQLTVDDQIYHWKEGEGILFDDTFVHSVKNDSSERRIVLFMDIDKSGSVFCQLIQNGLYLLIRISPIFRRALKKGKIKEF